MTSIVRVVALGAVANILALTALLLYALHEPEVATGVALVTVTGFVAGLLAAAARSPHDRVRSERESMRLGIAFVGAGALLVAATTLSAAAGDVAASVVLVVIAGTLAILGAGMLNAARMLRQVRSLISDDEEPLAVGLGANAMPGRARNLVVGTGGRIVWARGRKLGEIHTVPLTEVENFSTDPKTGTLKVVGGGEVLLVKPVAKRELEKFEGLLAGR
jgi:hypothetical protein